MDHKKVKAKRQRQEKINFVFGKEDKAKVENFYPTEEVEDSTATSRM